MRSNISLVGGPRFKRCGTKLSPPRVGMLPGGLALDFSCETIFPAEMSLLAAVSVKPAPKPKPENKPMAKV